MRSKTTGIAIALAFSLGLAVESRAQSSCIGDGRPPSVQFLVPAPDSSYLAGTEASTPGVTVVTGPLTMRVKAVDNMVVTDVWVTDDMPEVDQAGTQLEPQTYHAAEDPADPTVWDVPWAAPDRLPGHHRLQALAIDCAGNGAFSAPLDVFAF